jgi:hypothetical protein
MTVYGPGCHPHIILYFTFLFSLFVFVSAAGQYFSILTGSDQYNVFFRILFELVFRLRYLKYWPAVLTKTNRENKNVKYNIYQIVHGTKGHMGIYGPGCHQQNIIWTEAKLSWGPYTILWATDRSINWYSSQFINCHMALSDMNYLINIILYVFIFSVCLC